MHLRLERWASPLSPLLLVTDTKGILRALEYADYEPRMHWLLRRHYGSYTLEEGAAPLSLTQALDAYFAGCIDVGRCLRAALDAALESSEAYFLPKGRCSLCELL